MPQTPPPPDRRLRSAQISKACDSCKIRKIHCSGYPPPCQGCSVDQYHNAKLAICSPRDDLLIDRVLFGSSSTDIPNTEERFSLKGIGLLSGTHSVTFFSDSRLETLSAKLQNNKINDLIRRISAIINNKAKTTSSTSPENVPKQALPSLDQATAAKYIMTYYEQVHRLFPHLDRESFDSTISSGNLGSIIISDTAFSALYHAVLALGCLHEGGGSFEPGKGKAWELFSVALSEVPNLAKARNSLVALQAIATVAVYALGLQCLSIEQRVMCEMARMAQDLAPVLSKSPSAKIFYRIFWTIYAIEKTASFHFGRASAIVDSNIIIPMPPIPESNFGAFNWTLHMARHCRLLSRAMNTLFCPGVCHREPHYFLITIDQLVEDLEQWRRCVPEDFRPEHLNPWRRSANAAVSIWVNYLYYSFKLILLRSRLQITSHQGGDMTKGTHRDQLIGVSRSILEMVTYVDVEPSTPLWIIAGIPACATFVLFDHVISNPMSPDTRSNLALLDIAGGHFARIEFASGGSLPGSLLSEFTYIAREYINQCVARDLLKGSSYVDPTISQGESAMDAIEAVGELQPTNQDVEHEASSTTLGAAQAEVLNTTSYMDPIYMPIETLWDNGNDPLYGIDVMNIFNSIM
ncbi:hypothetical protein F53441_5718 [Fusarium austroafricanum]|uniref:Xylanolytic transcriptional activator regulatory domain-containing protein n=1 Tax=Fusarium austroafricanum TaxID=2364996 RepID=A0A8H4KHH5_9HYPO|nr:hypothetical protein F53441_5718 [Fusarium austroafricanum]